MANVIRTAQEWLNAKQKAFAGDAATYRRGAHSVELTVVLGAAAAAYLPDFGGTSLRRDEQEFFIEAADLVLSGSPATPTAGDLIDIEQGTATNRYRVSPPSEGEPVFSWDVHRLRYRINAKFQKAL